MIEQLYKKKIIRDFLSLFTENYWKQLIASILEYGIINFKKHHNIASLTPEDIFNIVEILKKEENLQDKTKTNFTVLNKVKKNTPNIPRSRSRSNSSSKDNNQVIKSNNLLKSINSNLKNAKTSTNVSSFSSEKNNTKFVTKTNISKARPSQTPTKEDNKKFGTFADNKKITNPSSRFLVSRSKSKNKSLIISKKENLVTKVSNANNENKSSNITNINNIKNVKNKPSYIYDSDHEGSGVKSSRIDTSVLNNKKTTEAEIPTEKKKKKPSEILEQIQLKKLKEKRTKVNNEGNSAEKDASIDNVTDDDSNKPKKQFSSSKFTNVESKLKNVIANDKKIYNMMKNNNSTDVITKDQQESKPTISDVPISYTPSVKEKFIGDGYSTNSYTDNRNPNNAKSSLLSLEERLNGLTQKISKVEKSSYKYNDDFIDQDTGPISLPVRSYIKNNLNNAPEKNNQFSYTNTYDYTKKSPLNNYNENNISSHNVQDEDYIAEDQIDLHKYNYLYNNINKNEDDQDNDNYDIDNHNYEDLEEEE